MVWYFICFYVINRTLHGRFLYEHYTRGSMLCYWYCHRGSLKEGQTLSFVFTTHDRQVRTFLWLFGYVLFSYYFNSCQNTRVQSGTLGIENHILGSMPNTSQRQKYSLPSNRSRKALILSSGISLLVSYFEETHLPLGWYQLRLRHFSTNLRSGPIWAVLIHSLWSPFKTVQILLHYLVKLNSHYNLLSNVSSFIHVSITDNQCTIT